MSRWLCRWRDLGLGLCLSLGLLLLGWLGGGLGAIAQPSSMPAPEVTTRVQSFLQGDVALTPADFSQLTVEPALWPDACLGLAETGELCAEVMTPGYEWTLNSPRGLLRVRSDRQGYQVRWVIPPNSDAPANRATPPPAAAAGRSPATG